MKRLKCLLLVLAFASVLVSCSKDEDDKENQTVTIVNRTAADLWDVYLQFDVDKQIQSNEILLMGESSQKISVPVDAVSVQVIFSFHPKGWMYGRIKDRSETESFDLSSGNTSIQLKNDTKCMDTYDDRE